VSKRPVGAVFHITKGQLSALMDLAYRGNVKKRELQQLAKVLEGDVSVRAFWRVYIPAEAIQVLIASARFSRREPGIAEAVASIQKLEPIQATSQNRRRTISVRESDVGPRRRCLGCGKMKPPGEFVRTRGTRCVECRRTGVTATRIRVIQGGSPGLGRRK